MLTEKTIIIISYDFINSKILNYKRVNLSDLKRIKYGTLKYPKSSFMGYIIPRLGIQKFYIS